MPTNKKIWYHGSPRLFERIEIGHPPASRTGPYDCVFITNDPKIAIAATGGSGWIYTVGVNAESSATAVDYELRPLEDIGVKRPDVPNCLKVYDASGLVIIRTQKLEEFKESLTNS